MANSVEDVTQIKFSFRKQQQQINFSVCTNTSLVMTSSLPGLLFPYSVQLPTLWGLWHFLVHASHKLLYSMHTIWLKKCQVHIIIIIIKRISRAPIYHTRWQHRALYNNTNHIHTRTHARTHARTHTHTHTHTHTQTQCWMRGWAGLWKTV